MVSDTIDLLGRNATDKVTGFAGVITSVCFDLFGCVQAVLAPGVNDEGDLKDGRWFDVSRLTLSASPRVMQVPTFGGQSTTPATYTHGPADKPLP